MASPQRKDTVPLLTEADLEALRADGGRDLRSASERVADMKHATRRALTLVLDPEFRPPPLQKIPLTVEVVGEGGSGREGGDDMEVVPPSWWCYGSLGVESGILRQIAQLFASMRPFKEELPV